MRAFATGFTSHLAGEAVSLCRLFTITRKDGAVIRFAEAQADLVRGGNTYAAAKGIRASSIPYTLNSRTSTVDFEIAAVDGGTIDPDDLRNGLCDSAQVVISAASHIDSALTPEVLFRGQFGDIEMTDRGLAKVQVLGLLSKAREVPIEHYTPTCRADFGDARCKKDLAPLTLSATVVSVSGFNVTVSVSPASHYRLGLIIPTSGSGVGEAYEIRGVSGSVLQTYLPTTGKLAAGDAINLTPGCDFTRGGPQGCKFWNNIVNFRGEPDIPGADATSINFTNWGA